MSRLAKEYGISDNGLAKICKRLKVPYPKRGYWAQKAAGKKVAKCRLLRASKDTPATASITASVPAKSTQGNARVTAQSLLKPIIGTLKIQGSNDSISRHRLVIGWLAEHAAGKRNTAFPEHSLSQWTVRSNEWTELDLRRYTILDTLFKTLEMNNCAIQEKELRKLFAVTRGIEMRFRLHEKKKKGKRPLRPFEAGLAENSGKVWVEGMVPTGRLMLSFPNTLPRPLKSKWEETDDLSLEQQIPEIVASIIAAGTILADREAKHEIEMLEHHKREVIKEAVRVETQLDDARWSRLVDMADQWKQAQLVSQFIIEVKTQTFDGAETADSKTVDEWIAWTEARIESANPANKEISNIFSHIDRSIHP